MKADYFIVGVIFFISLILGTGLGLLFHSFKTGGAIGLATGLTFITIFRWNRRSYK